MNRDPDRLRSIAATLPQHFALDGLVTGVTPWGNGHINDTLRITLSRTEGATNYCAQRINGTVFPDIPAVMDNIGRVLTHLQRRLEAEGVTGLDRRVLRLFPTREGALFWQDDEGGCWRVYRFIEGATTHESAPSAAMALQAARAFGAFESALADLPPPRLNEVLPGFHHTPTRLAAFDAAVARDAVNRAAQVRSEIAAVHTYRHLARVLPEAQARGELPERITHNDTKLNNVMIDDVTGEGLCVIDLDTVMPGGVLHDVGDMVRTMTSPAPEDRHRPPGTAIDPVRFEAVMRGYLSSTRGFLTPGERRYLALCGAIITFEIGVRFLTDYLDGDRYFKVAHPEHNLHRCRRQLALLESILARQEPLERIVETVWRNG